MHWERCKPGGAGGRPSCYSPLLSDPSAKFFFGRATRATKIGARREGCRKRRSHTPDGCWYGGNFVCSSWERTDARQLAVWLNLLRGCWSRGLKRRPLLQTSSPLEKASTPLHKQQMCPRQLSQSLGSTHQNCRCANLVCLNEGVHPNLLCPKCAVPCRTTCAKLRLFNTTHKCFRAG